MAIPSRFSAVTKPADPDSVAELICDLCIHDNEHIEAQAFCRDCEQYLCTSCHKVHQRGASTKQHFVMKGKDLPVERGKVDKPQADCRSNRPQRESRGPVKQSPVPIEQKRVVYLEPITVGSASDKYFAAINAVEITPDDFMLVCDYGNYKIKLLNSESELVAEVEVTSEPYAMTLLNSTDALITLPKEFCLQTVKIKSNQMLELESKIQTKLCCEKLIKYQDNLIVTAYDDAYFCISVIDKKGKLLRSIYHEPKDSLQVFKSYSEMAVSPDNKTIYITNSKFGCVGISVEGEILFKYKEPREKNHYGICTDSDGHVYIACFDSNKIIMISDTGEKIKDIVFLNGLRPSYVGYHQGDKKLFVGQTQSNKILCYQVKV